MPGFQQLFHFNLPIPVWQIALYAGLMSLFLLSRRVRLSLLTSYLFLLFWLYYSFRGDLLSLTKEDYLVQTVYHLFGCLLAGLGVFAYFFLERGQEVHLENLRKRNAEIAELKLRAKKAEKMAHALENQSEEAQRGFDSQESGFERKPENDLSAKIDELEDRLEDKENLLEKRNTEIEDLKLKTKEAEKRAQALKGQVEEAQRSVQAEASALKKKLEQELNAKLNGLGDRLRESGNLLEKRNAEIAAFKLKAEEAEKKAQALKTQAEETQHSSRAEASALKKKLDTRIDDLEKQLADRERLLEQRTAEIPAFKQVIEEEKQKAQALKTAAEEAQRSIQTEAATLKKKFEQELNAKIGELERRLKEREGHFERRAGEIAAFKQKAEEAEKRAQLLKTQAEETQRSVHTEASTLKKKLDERIDDLERRLKDKASLLDKRNAEIDDFKLKTEEAEQKAQALKTSLEEAQRSVHTETSAIKTKLEQELNAKLNGLGDRLRESENLLEKRNAEIAAFKMKAEEAEKRAQALKSQVEESQRDLHTEASVLKKKLDARIGDLEKQLKDKENLSEKRTGEIAAFKQKVEEAEKNARALKTKIEENQRDLHTDTSVLKKKLDARIDELEERLKEKEVFLEKRSGEIADLKLKSEEAEKRANAVKAHAQEAQRTFQVEAASLKKKLEQELNAKIGQLEQRLKDRESLVEKRNGETAALKLKAQEAEQKAQTLKTQVEETQKTARALMTKVAETQRGAQSQESTLKKKLEQELNAKVGEIERRLKESEALLEQRNGEIAVLKSKAEEAEKKAVALKNQGPKERPAPQIQDANLKKSLELEIKEKTLELKQLQEQVNHKDGLLSLMAKRNAELADLKTRADQRIDFLEAQLQEGQPGRRTEDSVTLQSYKPRDS